MYIDFPLDGNTPNSAVAPTFLVCLQEAPLGGSWPLAAANLRVRALRQGGRLGTHPKSGLKGLPLKARPLEAPGGPWRPRPPETPGDRWRPRCWKPPKIWCEDLAGGGP